VSVGYLATFLVGFKFGFALRNGNGGAGTNFKVGGGHRSGAKCRKKFFGCAPPLFGSKSKISRFGERFRDGQYSLVGLLFAVLLLPVPPPTCAPWSRRH